MPFAQLTSKHCQIGIKNALGILLAGRNVKAQEAKELGFVNEVVAADQLMDLIMHR